MKTNNLKLFGIITVIVSCILFTGFKKTDSRISDNYQDKVKQLSQSEKQGILYMMELEKLANEIFQFYQHQYNTPIFTRSFNTTERQKETIAWLIETYDIETPPSKKHVYNNENLQHTFNLLSRGSNINEAFMAGAMIENMKIVNLNKLMSETQNKDIIRVYKNLLRKAEKLHKNYVRKLERRGESFETINQQNQ